MKSRVLLILSLIFVTANIALAQTAKKTITNFDLEKYRLQREQAETDYRENYEKRGMPSPEELAKREAENRIKREELSRRLTFERQQTEQLNNMRTQIANDRAQINYLNNLNNSANQPAILSDNNQIFSGGYPIYGGINGYNYNNRRRNNRPIYRRPYVRTAPNRPTVVVGGGMVYTIPRPSTVPPPRVGYRRPNRRF